MFGREPRLPLDLLAMKEEPEWEAQYPGQWLEGHLKRLKLAHETAGKHLQRAASARRDRQDERGPCIDLRVGNQVVMRVRYRTRSKIQDFWGERVYEVTAVPGPGGGPYTIRPRDGLDGEKKVSRAEIRRFYPPLTPVPLGAREAPVAEDIVEDQPLGRKYRQWHIIRPTGPTFEMPDVRVPPPVLLGPPPGPASTPVVGSHDSHPPQGVPVPLRRSARHNKGVRHFDQ